MSWRVSAHATAHCLTGCAIGEVAGLLIGTALGWSNVATIALAVVLAFVFGYALTMHHLQRHMPISAAIKTALLADTLSIFVMEITDNAVMIALPGAMHAHVDELWLYGALAISLAIAFVVAWPVNHWLIGRGQGHALHHKHL